MTWASSHAAAVLLLGLGVACVRQDQSDVAAALQGLTDNEEVQTDRSARVEVINLTGERITAVALVHKYSDEAPDKFSLGVLERGATSQPFVVNYKTGFMRTGQDWWKIAWCSSDGTELYISSPSNARGFMDWMEGLFKGTIGGIISNGLTLVTLGLPITDSNGKRLGSAVADAIAGNGGTAGFKSFILREADDNAVVRIKLMPEGKILFSSPSGEDDTVYIDQHMDDHKAKAVVVNLSGKRISAVVLAHKYSEGEPETAAFPHLEHGESSTPMTVYYKTGFLRTGADWWKLGWFSADGKDTFVTKTGGLSTFLNGLEKLVISEGISSGLSAVSGAAGFTSGGLLTDSFSDALATQMETAFKTDRGEGGYEKHTLTAADAGGTVTLHVLPDGVVKVFAPTSSGELKYVKIGDGTTTKLASVVVINRTGKRVSGLALIHKYSDDAPEKYTVPALEDGETSPSFTVHYRTGFLRTGKDWWRAAWCSSDGTEVFVTKGGAMNGVLDVLGGMLMSTVGAAVSSGLVVAGAPVAAGIGSQLADGLAGSLIGEGGTAGYESLTLSDADLDKVVTITLLPPGADGGGKVQIRSPSGSETDTDYLREKR